MNTNPKQQPETVVFDITKVIITDLDGTQYPITMAKPLGNLCFMNFNTIEWDGLARAIHAEQPCDMTMEDLHQLQGLIRNPQVRMMTAARSGVNEYIEDCIKELQQKELKKAKNNGLKTKHFEGAENRAQ